MWTIATRVEQTTEDQRRERWSAILSENENRTDRRQPANGSFGVVVVEAEFDLVVATVWPRV